ncbi:hypothetical protein [Paenibacillus sp. SN-8-1]|uniref:hypothetical protein n=1 Tax=Paenibacillus sp. SN-8-1 TaxID=3435409 RepID=UPI003D9A3190
MQRKITSLLACAIIIFGLGSEKSYAASEVHSDTQPIMEWSQKYGENSTAKSVSPTSDGGYVMAGEITEIDYSTPYPDSIKKAYIVKTDAAGKLEWEQKVTYANHESESSTAYKAVQTRDGGYIVTGSTDIDRQTCVFLIKLSPRGEVEWKNAYEGYYFQSGQAVLETSDGGFVTTGFSAGYATGADAYVLKTDAQGRKLWMKYYNFSGDQYFSDIIPARDGGYVAVGNVNIDEYSSGPEDFSVILKLNEQGEKVWEEFYKRADGAMRVDSVIPSGDPDQGYLILQRKWDGKSTTPILTQTDLRGKVIWEKTYDQLSKETSLGQVVRTEQGYALIGGIYDATESSIKRKYQHVILTLDKSGGLIDNLTFGGADSYALGKGIYTNEGGFVLSSVTGYSSQQKATLTRVLEPKTEPSVSGSFYLDSDEYSISVGTSIDTVAYLKDTDGSLHNVTKVATFYSENPEIAEYDKEGNIIGHRAGITYINAVYKGQTYRASVQVLRAFVPIEKQLIEE